MKFKQFPHISPHHRHPVPVRPVPPAKQHRVTRPAVFFNQAGDEEKITASTANRGMLHMLFHLEIDYNALNRNRGLHRLSRRVVRG